MSAFDDWWNSEDAQEVEIDGEIYFNCDGHPMGCVESHRKAWNAALLHAAEMAEDKMNSYAPNPMSDLITYLRKEGKG
jgi:hypothetical protein